MNDRTCMTVMDFLNSVNCEKIIHDRISMTVTLSWEYSFVQNSVMDHFCSQMLWKIKKKKISFHHLSFSFVKIQCWVARYFLKMLVIGNSMSIFFSWNKYQRKKKSKNEFSRNFFVRNKKILTFVWKLGLCLLFFHNKNIIRFLRWWYFVFWWVWVQPEKPKKKKIKFN